MVGDRFTRQGAAAALLAGLCVAAAPAPAVELCAALDGSRSLSQAQFALQLEGLARAVEDPAVVPRDGSVTLSVVVFEWGARVEVPATAVSGDAGAAFLAAAIRAIPWRYGHRTDMAAAITACIGQFRDRGERWVIDLSTDGRHSASLGTDPLAARDAAAGAGLDVLNALGVGDADTALLSRLVWPQPASPFPQDGFVTYVPEFTAFVHAMREKIAAELALPVAVDIKPGSCPNPFNPRSRGLLPVAVLGAPDLDVRDIDPASLRLQGVAPVRWSVTDAAAPWPGRPSSCSSCATAGPDGLPDLVLHFDRRALAAALGPVAANGCLLVGLRGNLAAGAGRRPIRGADTLRITRN